MPHGFLGILVPVASYFLEGHYLMTCMQPMMVMVVFYLNYFYLAPKLFVSGKHRYDLLINIVLLVTLGTFVHYWMDYVNMMYIPGYKSAPDAIGTISYIARDILNLAVFAAGATALALTERGRGRACYCGTP